MRLRDGYRPLLIRAALVLLLAGGGAWLAADAWPGRLNLVLYDVLLPLQAQPPSEQVVVVAIDDASLQALGRWPWSRRRHAELLDRLDAMGARAVAFDMLFPEAQADDPQADALFAAALARNGQSVLAVAPVQLGEHDPISEMLPIPLLAQAAAALGHVDVELDMDGLCRRHYLYAGLGDARWPALPLALLQLGGETEKPAIAMQPGNAKHWVRRGHQLIPFAAPGQRPLSHSYADVLAGRVPAAAIAGKYVLVGVTATGLGDAISTPAARSHERMAGVDLNAHILSGLLRGNSIQALSPPQAGLLSALLILLGASLVLWLPLRRGLLATGLAMLAPLLVSGLLLVLAQLWFAPLAALLMIGLAWPAWALWQLGVEQRISENLQRRLQHLASHHISTGLPNQGLLEQRLRELLQDGDRPQGIAALAVLHVNWPGSASSILGKPMGDAMLQAIGRSLRSAVRAEDFLAHLSGDDFAVLFTGIPDQAAVRRASVHLLQKLQRPIQQDDRQVILAPRIGVSIWPGDGPDAVSLLRNAYTAMFKSRIDGTDLLCIYSADIGQELQARSQLEQALLHALERGEFEIHYQPQLAADGKRILGVEALLRWHNPTLGWVEPDAFIPVAEHAGMINTIGRWVLRNACRQLRAWQDAGLGPLRLAVNLSPQQFISPRLLDDICSIVEETGITPQQLELEITETTLMRDLNGAIHTMQQIKAKGMQLAIDDFGTGYSSLSSLRHFPLDRIKIDKSFTREIGNNQDATEISLAIITMGKRLRLQVIAEGVETAEQAEFLRRHDCDELQGYLFSQAVPAAQLEPLLRRHNVQG